MSIKKFNTLHLPNDRYFQFYTAFHNLVLKFGVAALKIAPQWTAFLTHFGRVDEALKKILKSAFTRQLIEADVARDEVFSGLAGFNRAMCKHFDPARREAAMRLQVVFDTYGNIARKPLNDETSAVYNLIQDLTREKYVEDVRAIGGYGWVEELDRRNKAFDALMTRRFEETGEKCDINLKAERAQLDEVYRGIVRRVNALIEVDGEADYKAFVETLNAIIAKYAVKRHKRGGSGAAEEEEDEETEEGGEEA